MKVILPVPMKVIEQWRQEFNHERPHGTLNGVTPIEYVEKMAGIG
jgi:transposase InsO family protein